MQLRTRAEWGARSPKGIWRKPLSKPSTGHWNGPRVPDYDHSRCDTLVRGVQNFHMDGRGWNDIAYNFVICPHGVVYEGRGLNTVNGANGTNAGNQSSHAIMWLSGEGNDFNNAQRKAFRECVRYVADHTEAPDDAIGHRDHKSTACPGDARYHWIHQNMPVDGALSPSPSPGGSAGGGQPVLRRGSTGDAVRLVQQIIHDKAGGGLTVDGQFGPVTEKRVKDVQRFFNLSPDGIVGPKTWGVLNYIAAGSPPKKAAAKKMAAKKTAAKKGTAKKTAAKKGTAKKTAAKKAPPKKEPARPGPFGDWPRRAKSTMRSGARGDQVRYLQNVIARKAGGGIRVDGIFGPNTLRRVVDVQRLFRIDQDGIVGPDTWGVIDYLATH